jgi:hypothetical protein
VHLAGGDLQVERVERTGGPERLDQATHGDGGAHTGHCIGACVIGDSGPTTYDVGTCSRSVAAMRSSGDILDVRKIPEDPDDVTALWNANSPLYECFSQCPCTSC